MSRLANSLGDWGQACEGYSGEFQRPQERTSTHSLSAGFEAFRNTP